MAARREGAHRGAAQAPAPTTSPAHWHYLGHQMRPLHQQLDCLQQALAWAVPTAANRMGDSKRPVSEAPAPNFALASVVSGHDYSLLVLQGVVDSEALAQLRHQLHCLLSGGVSCIVIDAGGITACDGRLGSLLARAQLRARTRGAELRVSNVPLELGPTLDLGHLAESLITCDDAQDSPSRSGGLHQGDSGYKDSHRGGRDPR